MSEETERRLEAIKRVARDMLQKSEQVPPATNDLSGVFVEAMEHRKAFLRNLITSRPPAEMMKFLEELEETH